MFLIIRQLFAIVVAIACLCVQASGQSVQPPAGYRFPVESDVTGDWKEYRADNPTPFHDQGDFNGDGVQDDVWLLPSKSGKNGFGVFAFLGFRSGAPTVIRLASARNEPAQSYGVGTAKPGRYETACGKGYWECKKGEPEKLNLKIDSIAFYVLTNTELGTPNAEPNTELEHELRTENLEE